MSVLRLVSGFALLASAFTLVAAPAQAGRPRAQHEAAGHLTWASPQANPIALSPDGAFVYVANTTSNTVSVISTATQSVVRNIGVGLEPVSVAVRPDGNEVWVANHVSDSVSVIDTDPASASYRRVVETIQDLDVASGVTDFDEPVGVAFASSSKAYVALSSTNRIAIVDATTYSVTGHLAITAQDPRAIAVANGRLYVTAFESGNKTELSSCGLTGAAPDCTLLLPDLFNFATNPNVPGLDKNIVIDSQVPDRDLFVFETTNDTEAKDPVSGIGTLLYGIVVDAADNVYITQTDALNDINGITSAGFRTDPFPSPSGDGDVNLADLENRMFLNEIAVVDCSGAGQTCSFNPGTDVFDLDGGVPTPSTALATPYGIALSADGSTIVGTAAGTSRVFSMGSGGGNLQLLDLEDTGVSGDEGQQIPRGIAFDSTGATGTAYVLNTLENTVSVVTVGSGGALTLGARIAVGSDKTPAAVRRGRIAFNNAFAASTGSFSCASCHPDGNTDQLLWRIGGECFLDQGPGQECIPFEDEPRTTMPVRGLRDSLPLHWDGTLGDPFGGDNGANGTGGGGGSNCTLGAGGDQQPCFRQLVDASLSGVMCAQVDTNPVDGHFRECVNGPSGLPGLLSVAERDDMATFLERVSYPPARSRSTTDLVSAPGPSEVCDRPDPDTGTPAAPNALCGFEDFFLDQGGVANDPQTCADSNAGCHELPLGTATNSEVLQAFDAPTMRGMTDRFVQFSLAPTGSVEFLFLANIGVGPPLLFPPNDIPPLEPSIQWDPDVGMREITTFGAAFAVFDPTYNVRPLNIFEMFEEASTGHSGALGRQVSLNTTTTASCTPLPCDVDDLLADLELADERGLVNLGGVGMRFGGGRQISYLQATSQYQVGEAKLSRAQMIAEAQTGTLIATLTANLRSGVSEDTPQPLIAPTGAQCDTPGGPNDPNLPSGSSFSFEGAHVVTGDAVFLNGQDTGLTVTVTGTSTACGSTDGHITTQALSVSGLPGTATQTALGTDLLQIRSANGLLSNEMPLP